MTVPAEWEMAMRFDETTARIQEGIAAAYEGRLCPAADALADIAKKHGFAR